jgi:hypothetical protein
MRSKPEKAGRSGVGQGFDGESEPVDGGDAHAGVAWGGCGGVCLP